MSASSSSQPDHHPAGPTCQPQDSKHRRHNQHRHLKVQVPAVATTGCFAGCFRPSPTPTSAGNAHAHAHADRPASPSLIRSPSAWIRARGHSFGSTRHTRRRSGDFQYDARSYARNFDDVGEGDGEEEAGLAAGDALKYRCFSSRLPASPPAPSPTGPCAGGNGSKGKEPARETGRDLE